MPELARPTLALPLREALLLLPVLPAEVAVTGPVERWLEPLAACGARPAPRGSGSGVAVGEDVEALVATGADALLLVGPDRGRRLAAAGYESRTWRATQTVHGTPAVVPEDDTGLTRRLRSAGRRSPRQLAVDLLRSGERATVAVRGAATPLVLAALDPPPSSLALLVGGASARRRPVFLVGGADGRVERVVKVGLGPDGPARAVREQAVLASLAARAVSGVPLPLGHGTAGAMTWSAETAVPGEPLLDVLAGRPAERGLRLLEQAAAGLSELAARSRGELAADAGLRLRPPHDRARELLPPSVPGVLVHGDVAANAVVDGAGSHVGILDWETARDGGLPLHDLLPLLCLGLLRVRRVRDADAPDVLLAALRGSGPDGSWLLAQVRTALDRVDVPHELGGALAGLALAGWASMRLVHDELVLAEGGGVTAWRSPAEQLAPAWSEDPALGARWVALLDRA